MIPLQGFSVDKPQRLYKNVYHKDGYVFQGWASNSVERANAGIVDYKDEALITVDSDMTLYAVWDNPPLTLAAESADWLSGSITLRCEDSDTSGTAHEYTLEYKNASGAWEEVDGAKNKLATKGQDANGREAWVVQLTDNTFWSRLGGIPPVEYRVKDESGRVSGTSETRNRHALFVAIDKYKDETKNLSQPTHEAAVFRGTYKKYAGVNRYLCTLIDVEAKKDTIINQLDNIAKNYAKPGDIVLFYHVGHGLYGGLCCHDKDRILWAHELSEKFQDFPAGVGVVAVVYACFSGSMIDIMGAEGTAQVGWLASSQSNEISKSGMFTDVICNKGWLDGEADEIGGNVFANGDGVVSFAELAAYGQQEMGDNFSQYGRMMTYKNSRILEHIIAGKVPERSKSDRFWSWLAKLPSFLVSSDDDPEKAAAMTAANGCRTVGECYALGIDPEDPDDDLKIAEFKMKDGKPEITLNHTEDGSGNSFEDRVKVLGKAELTDAEWQEVPPEGNPAHRFFKVDVEMP